MGDFLVIPSIHFVRHLTQTCTPERLAFLVLSPLFSGLPDSTMYDRRCVMQALAGWCELLCGIVQDRTQP